MSEAILYYIYIHISFPTALETFVMLPMFVWTLPRLVLFIDIQLVAGTIPICKRCDLHNPAELSIKSKETGEELELICTECAEYCDDQGNPLE